MAEALLDEIKAMAKNLQDKGDTRLWSWQDWDIASIGGVTYFWEASGLLVAEVGSPGVWCHACDPIHVHDALTYIRSL
jgi:hypothetical protein